MIHPSVFFRLIRWQNLLVVAIIPILFRFCIIEPLLIANELESALSRCDFFVLVCSVVLMTAAGYVINDYFDLRIDKVNKNPIRVIVGNQISRRSAIMIHWVLNFLSVSAGFYVAWQTRYWLIMPAVLTVPLLLSLYSIWFKKSMIAGNLIVALLAALLIPFFWLVEMRSAGLSPTGGFGFEILAVHVLFFPVFAFLTTMVREIVKDMEDYEGDMAGGRKTLAIAHGIPGAALVASIFSGFTIAVLIAYIAFLFFLSQPLLLLALYLLICVVFPLVYISFHIHQAKAQSDYKRIQSLLKITMIAGVLSSFLHFFLPAV